MSPTWPNPFIEQRADPFILRHEQHYYFVASVPEYDRLEIRRATTLADLRSAEPVWSGASRRAAPAANSSGHPSCTISTGCG